MATKAPFPWFGGKSKAAELIWSRLGSDCRNYVEPFLGSAAVFLGRPTDFSGWVTLNDLDGHIVNFWRSVKFSPDKTALAAANPVFEADLHARHLKLVGNESRLAARLMADPQYHEPELAGWWAWGACVWIGSKWCSGKGPWHAEPDKEGIDSFTKGNGEKGVKRQLPHLGNGGTGVNRKLPHLDGGKGVNRQLPHLGNGAGVTEQKLEWVRQWFVELQDNFREARIACGSWDRIMSPLTMTRNGVCGVVLDPPYSQTDSVYSKDSSTVSGDVRKWCIENGDNTKLRIALCGHAGEHEQLESMGWKVKTWAKSGGYQGADDRERIWFSPHCKHLIPKINDLI